MQEANNKWMEKYDIYYRRKSYSAGGVQVRLERITEHAKINHHLGRFVLPFSRALVLRARFESG